MKGQKMTSAAMQALVLCCSLIPLLLGGQAAARTEGRPGKAWSEAQLKQVLVAFGQDNTSASTLRKLGQPAVLSRVAALQSTTPTGDALHYFTTFTLAYFGRDYQRNVRTLAYPVQLLTKDNSQYQADYVASDPVSFDPAEDVPDLLVRLYDHNHDPNLLKLLFSFGLDGAYGENLIGLRSGLIGEYPLNVLDAIRHSRAMTGEAIEALVFGEPESKGPDRDIRRALGHAKPAVRRFGRWFLREYARERRARRKELGP
jgi:hypothetical protein